MHTLTKTNGLADFFPAVHPKRAPPDPIWSKTNVPPKTKKTKTRKRRRRPQVREGKRRAAVQAFTGALLVLEHGFTQVDAAEACGSNPAYVGAARDIVRTGDAALRSAVIEGRAPLLASGSRARRICNFRVAYARVNPNERAAAFHAVGGVNRVLDDLVVAGN